MLRGPRASAAAMVGQAVILIRFALEDDQSLVQTNAPRVQAGGVLFLLSSNQQPRSTQPTTIANGISIPPLAPLAGLALQGAADARDALRVGRRAQGGRGKRAAGGRSGLPWSPARGAGRERPGNGRYRPISSFTSRKQETAKSRSSRLWPALTCVRMRALPFGTTG